VECTNEFITLHKLPVQEVEYYEMIQFIAMVHYSHFMNWNFEVSLAQWAECGLAVPTLEQL
jgi:hypothetical protein